MRMLDVMTTNVESIAPDVPASDAWDRMRDKRIHHLVVTKGGTVVGVVSDRDLGGKRGARLREGRSVADCMTDHVVSAYPTTTVKQAANLLRGRNIGSLPILDEPRGKLVGIVTVSDLLSLLGRGLDRSLAKAKQRGSTRRRDVKKRTGLR